MNKKIFIVLGLSLILVSLILLALRDRPSTTNNPPQKYKEVSDYYIPGLGGYACSRPIKVHVENGQERPVDPDEAKLLCHMTSAEEYKGKITVLQRPEVIELMSRYQYKEVSIKALEFKYIEDKEYVHRLLPSYKDREIGCIIILQTPNEKLVYLEDETLETFEQMDSIAFDGLIAQSNPADQKLFYDNLR